MIYILLSSIVGNCLIRTVVIIFFIVLTDILSEVKITQTKFTTSIYYVMISNQFAGFNNAEIMEIEKRKDKYLDSKQIIRIFFGRSKYKELCESGPRYVSYLIIYKSSIIAHCVTAISSVYNVFLYISLDHGPCFNVFLALLL